METQYSLFSRDGLRVQFTDAFGTMQQFEAVLQMQLGSGWSVTEPSGLAQEKTVKITGFILTSSEDKKLGQFMPAVLLFSDFGQYAQCTVYHEHLDQLPIDLKAKSIKVWDSGSVTRDLAQKKGYMNKCDMNVVMVAKLDISGEVVKNDKGYIQYKFGRMAGSTAPQATSSNVPEFSMNDVAEDASGAPDDLWAPNKYPEKKAAGEGFKWGVDDEWLSIASGVIHMGDELPELPAKMVTYFTKLNHESDDKPMSPKQYGFLGSLIDKRYGDNSHRMILSALCSVPVTGEKPPGWKVKELLDSMLQKNEKTLGTLDKLAEFIKGVIKEVEEA